MKRLNINIDHVATVRQARRAPEPSLVAAAMMCEAAGADGITVHLRADRRHIQDRDLYVLREAVTTYLNVEMAVTDEMLAIASDVRPDAVSLVEEKHHELTTERGLDVRGDLDAVRRAVDRLRECGIIPSLFIDPDHEQIEAARASGAEQVELCTAVYAELTTGREAARGDNVRRADEELARLRRAATLAAQYGLRVAAGHGLTYRNVARVAAIAQVEEFNIGHNVIARALFAGLDGAVREMRERIREGAYGFTK